MGATGRKLTIRMPDNPRLRSAEVGKVHLDPGARVQSGNPVLTLMNRRKEHLVRAPRAGRVVPLIAPGDRVNGGDPLYILHIDEAALEERQREDRAMIAVEREKWTSGVLADAIEPIRRNRPEETETDVPAFVANWGKPVLALALYVLACFVLLPILHLFGKTASMPVLIAMVAGCIAFAAMIFYLYAPEAGRWPRLAVRMVAFSWIGISAVALFYRPDDPNELTIENAIGPVARLFSPTEETPLAPPPDAAPVPVAVVQSGVAVGPTEAKSTPTQSEPVTVLAEYDGQIIPHGVQVREWGRVNPHNGSGDEMVFTQADTSLAVQIPPQGIALAAIADTPAADLAPELPEDLRTAPKRAERNADIIMAAIPQIQDSDLTPARIVSAHALRDENTVSVAAFPDRVADPAAQLAALTDVATVPTTLTYGEAQPMQEGAVPVLRGQMQAPAAGAVQLAAIPDYGVRLSATDDSRATAPGQPAQVLSPGLNLVAALRSGDSDWAQEQLAALSPGEQPLAETATLPASAPNVLRAAAQPAQQLAPEALQPAPRQQQTEGAVIEADSAPTQPDLAPQDLALDLSSTTASTLPEPQRVAGSRSPGLVLISAVRAGEADWMLTQAQMLGEDRDIAQRNAGPATQRQLPVTLASLGSVQIEAAPAEVNALSAQIGTAKIFAMAVLPVLDGVPAPPVLQGEGPTGLQIARLEPFGAVDIPREVGRTTTPQGVPSAPQVQPEQQLIQRDLIYLYFDDPRILSHPQMGDPWQGLTSPELASAIDRTEVVDVYEMLQVQNWCAAANDPDGSKRAELGADYTTAFINDRIRLLRVRLSVDETATDLLETEIPLFDGTPAGFFHNKAPLLAGLPEDGLMEKGREYLRSLSAGIFDPNAPDAIGGGQYFDNAVAVSVILRGAGCDQARLNDGDGPANEIGRILETRLGG